jgi:hypothetical protein
VNPGIRKLASRKAMRVATVFTGVASAAAFAAPANAQAVAKVTPGAALRATLYDAGVGVNSYARGGCTSLTGESHWFQISNDATEPGTIKCYGGMGTTTDVGAATGFCGGNNVGFFSGHTVGGKHLTHQHFSQSNNPYYFRSPKFPGDEFTFSKLTISAFFGNEIC